MGRRSEHVCQGCGAPLPPAQPGVTRACTYCGRVAVSPAKSGVSPGAAKKVALLWAVGGVLVATSLSTWAVFRSATTVDDASSPWRAPSLVEVPAGPPEAVDVPAPQVTSPPARVGPRSFLVARPDRPQEDLLVTMVPVDRAVVVLALLEADTGGEIWRREFEPEQAPRPLRALVDRTLVVFTLDGRMLGLDPQRGTTLWARSVAEEPRALCATEGIVGVRLDRGIVAFTGATGEDAAPPRDCAPVYTSQAPAPNFDHVEGPALATWLPAGHEFFLQRGLHPHRGAARVALGREPGEQGLASVGVLEGKRWRWRATLHAEEPADANFLGAPLAAVRHERVFVPYVRAEGALHLASFDLGTGRRRWDRALGVLGPEDTELEVLASLSGKVFVRVSGGTMSAIEPHRGDVAWSIGPE